MGPTAATPVVPTGAEHTFAPGDIFFSTTDTRGVIEQVNSVFVRLSHHPREELIGAPHNIIRHPDMPAGAFKLVWDTLEAGQRVCAYVKNLAANGSAYWVFATITPLGDGYLSVRNRPCREDLKTAASQMYDIVRPREIRARDERGLTATAAAEEGLQDLAEQLGSAGFASYDDFQLMALPAEVAALTALSAGLPDRGSVPGPLGDMLTAIREIDRDLSLLVGRLDHYQELIDVLRDGVARTSEVVSQLGAATDTADEATGQVGELAPVLANTTRVIVKHNRSTVTALREAGESMRLLGELTARLRFRIALATLHNVMTGRFVVELLDGIPDASAALPAIPALCRAVDEGVGEVARSLETVTTVTEEVAHEIEAARTAVELSQSLIANWRSLVARARLGLMDVVGEVEPAVRELARATLELDELAATCRHSAIAYDAGPVHDQLSAMQDALARL